MSTKRAVFIGLAFSWLLLAVGQAQEATISVHPDQVRHRLSPYLTGACIEDVNHEIYGGLYSQMIFGESFQEPPPPAAIVGFTAYGGQWRVRNDELWAEAGDGPKLILDNPSIVVGTVSAQLFFAEDRPGNAGLIVNVTNAGKGADKFTGYEVSLETSGHLVLGRHRQNWEPIRTVPCDVPVGRWINLTVKLEPPKLEVRVDGKTIMTYEDTEHPLRSGRIGLRPWQRPVRYRNLRIEKNGGVQQPKFQYASGTDTDNAVSGMWRVVKTGSAKGRLELTSKEPFLGKQSQRITFQEGKGEIGVENQGLNRWGLSLLRNRRYEGYVWLRVERPTKVRVSLDDFGKGYVTGGREIEVSGEGWHRYDFAFEVEFNMVSRDFRAPGRFAITLTQPGSVDVGHVFLQPGDWGRFKGLPDRKDVGDALVDQGITVLRYGGSMINHASYRWKNMIGPRDRRPMTPGTWYPYSTNGWGIFDFLNFCEAAGFLGIPAVNMDETPSDMADFIEYTNGPADSEWGKKRAADGHPAPYKLKYLELGNEENVNEAYWKRFQPIAEAIWAKDKDIILVVGDFAYGKVITDPDHIEGSAGAKSLAAHKKILELAKAHDGEVWFDLHIGTEQPPAPGDLKAERSFIDQLVKLVPGTKAKIVIFEFNSGNHAVRRAISNASAILQCQRIGDRLPIACSANCLQPDGQNDNDWDQGLLFLNSQKVWLQPPGYVTRMVAKNNQPFLVGSDVSGGPSESPLLVNATKSEDGKALVLEVVNSSRELRSARIDLGGFPITKPSARGEELTGPWDGVNTADEPEKIKPREIEMKLGPDKALEPHTFPPLSFTVIRFE